MNNPWGWVIMEGSEKSEPFLCRCRISILGPKIKARKGPIRRNKQ